MMNTLTSPTDQKTILTYISIPTTPMNIPAEKTEVHVQGFNLPHHNGIPQYITVYHSILTVYSQYITVYHSIPQYITVYHIYSVYSQYITVYSQYTTYTQYTHSILTVYHSIPHILTVYHSILTVYHSILQYTHSILTVYHSISQYTTYTQYTHSIPQYITVYSQYTTVYMPLSCSAMSTHQTEWLVFFLDDNCHQCQQRRGPSS